MGAIGDMLSKAAGETSMKLTPIREIKVGEVLSVDGTLWYVRKAEDTSDGYGIWADGKEGGGRWLFGDAYLVVSRGRQVPAIEYQVPVDFKIESVIGEDGIERNLVSVYYVTQEMWDKYDKENAPGMIGSIYGDGVTGPGYYYLAGSDPYTGYDVWRKVVRVLRKHGELIGMPGTM